MKIGFWIKTGFFFFYKIYIYIYIYKISFSLKVLSKVVFLSHVGYIKKQL